MDTPDHPTPRPPTPGPPPGRPAARPGPPPGQTAPPPGEQDVEAPQPKPGEQAPDRQPSALAADAREYGRVADDGTVYVRTADGERAVGQMPDATPEEALAFYVKRYEDLAFEIELLEQRVAAGTLAPDEATGSVRQVRRTLVDAQAVGDLDRLGARLEALTGTIAEQRAERRAEKARRSEQARVEKDRIATAAEQISESTDWRNGANRMRDLLEEWKSLPRIDKATDDALWRRFSTARTTYTRRRKAHFAELNEKREEARVVKERLVDQAEALADSTDWGPTSGRYRDLMREWKAAGPAPKNVDEALWKRFRGAQDTFFGNRDRANAELDQEYEANAVRKEELLSEAEALVPVQDLRAAREAFREIAERWDVAGKVPRARIKDLEGRMRKVEHAIRGVEDDQWRRSNPEARARAADTVAQLESSIADLERQRDAAAEAGRTKKAEELDQAAEARRSWLTEAQKALTDFS